MKAIAFIGQFQENSDCNVSAKVKTLTETREGNDQSPDNIELKLRSPNVQTDSPENLCYLHIFKEFSPKADPFPSNSTGTQTRGHGDKDASFEPSKLSMKTASETREEQEQRTSLFAIPRI